MESLQDAARKCLQCSDVPAKLAETARVHGLWGNGGLAFDQATTPPLTPAAVVGRPDRPRLVAPRHLPKRSLGTEAGRAALLHAVAHIEFNAINLAWDAVYRFQGMPREYYDDWVGIAADEARHFTLVASRLAELGHAYGDFDAHDGLWVMAEATAVSCLERMALVPRVLEARGLDVTPGMIARLRAAGDEASVAVLEIILREEVAHVAAGSRWFAFCCKREGREPQATFVELIRSHPAASPRPPFNRRARLAAGFSSGELEQLACMSN